jgi:predicted lipid-binding transport protein (Tim44 family)
LEGGFKERILRNITMEQYIADVSDLDVLRFSVVDDIAEATVNVTIQQAIALKDASGAVIEGDPVCTMLAVISHVSCC